ncbi:cytochrome b5 [Meredithblackwellia eburnea MCA 4105]
MVHQKYLAEKRAKEEALAKDPSKAKKEGGGIGGKLLWYSLLAVLVSTFLSRSLTETWLWGYEGKYSNPAKIYSSIFPPKERFFSEHELAKYDGSNPSSPIYLAIDGDVYDVSNGRSSYGPGGSYAFFAGKDAARAFVTGCFKTHLTHDIRGFTDKDMRSLLHWKNFFKNSQKYTYVGKVGHAPIDPESPLPEPC